LAARKTPPTLLEEEESVGSLIESLNDGPGALPGRGYTPGALLSAHRSLIRAIMDHELPARGNSDILPQWWHSKTNSKQPTLVERSRAELAARKTPPTLLEEEESVGSLIESLNDAPGAQEVDEVDMAEMAEYIEEVEADMAYLAAYFAAFGERFASVGERFAAFGERFAAFGERFATLLEEEESVGAAVRQDAPKGNPA